MVLIRFCCFITNVKSYKDISWGHGSADGSNEDQDTVMHDDSPDDDSEGSVYDAQEEQDGTEDEENDGGSNYDTAEESNNRANGSGEDGKYEVYQSPK
jgi:hypothetical protein